MITFICLLWVGTRLNAACWYYVILGIGITFRLLSSLKDAELNKKIKGALQESQRSPIITYPIDGGTIPHQIQELQEACKPLIAYLQNNSDPYTEICISQEGIKTKQTVIGIPSEKAVNLEVNCPFH